MAAEAMAAEPRVRVAVVTSDSGATIAGLLAGLPAACAEVQWELVVADNNSSDDTLAKVASSGFHGTVVRMGRNAGYAAGVNAAAAVPGPGGGTLAVGGKAAAFDALLVVSPNVRLERGAVARLWRSLKAEPRAGIAVPRLEDPDGRIVPTLGRRPAIARALGAALLGERLAGRSGLGEVVTAPRAYDDDRTVAWASGSAMLIAARCLDEIGPLDESFLLYAEATELSLRAADAGWSTVYNPDARGRLPGPLAVAAPRLRSLRTTNRVRLYARRTGPVRGAAYWGAVALGESLGALRGRPGSRDALAALVRKSRRVRELDELLPADGFELVPAAGEAPEAPAAEPDGFERTAPEPPAPIGDDVLHFGDELDDEPAGHEVSR